MNIPANLKYTNDHEWLRVEDEIAYVGITEFAQGELGDVVFVEVETVGEVLAKGESFGTIEAVKTVSDMFMPVAGEIIEFNSNLESSPELINKDPYEEGWIIKLRIEDPSGIEDLLSDQEYGNLIGA